ncbi:alpha/beta fold hydrolase [Niveibacterium sp. SC-1]|uniref:alpha/beta fold hydrolase n=1 Tax=Niveibacterium sp. SC-1 TaxID=3135646 RepID=UPI00311F3D85
MPPTQLLFLPGALGRTGFWQPVAARMAHPAEHHFLGWPGFGDEPADPAVRGLDDLVTRVITRIDRPTALIAQSMGGLIAMRAALEKSEWVTHLVLSATSGGIDVAALGGAEWREAFQAANPQLPRWFADRHEDLSARLPAMQAPTLLLWGGVDAISPLRVGERLRALLPDAVLHYFPRGEHDLVRTHAEAVAGLIDRHLGLG